MKAHQSQQFLERKLADSGLTLDQLTVDRGVREFIEFYRNQRADDCPADSNGDMLLYQWGVGSSAEKHFELDLTRQFVVDGDAEDENIWQLSLTFRFVIDEELRAIGSGNKWCPTPKALAVDYFERFVRGSAVYQLVADLQPIAVELNYENAG